MGNAAGRKRNRWGQSRLIFKNIEKLTSHQAEWEIREVKNLKIIENQSIYCQFTLNVNYLINLLTRINIMKIIELKNNKSFYKNIVYIMMFLLMISCGSSDDSTLETSGEISTKALLHQWTFNDGTANDIVGETDGELKNGAEIIGGKLVLDGIDDYVRTSPIKTDITNKTLMAWVTLSNVYQRGGGLITLENPDPSCSVETFDSIVYGERMDKQWIAGSDFFNRTPIDNGGSLETIESVAQEIYIAIVYNSDNSIQIYRNGNLYSSDTMGVLQNYSANSSDVLLGLRHQCTNVPGTPNGLDRFLAASINEARIYSTALSDSEILRIFEEGPQ